MLQQFILYFLMDSCKSCISLNNFINTMTLPHTSSTRILAQRWLQIEDLYGAQRLG